MSDWAVRPLSALADDAPATYVLSNATVRVGRSFEIARAVRVNAGLIEAVGDAADVIAGRGEPVYDLDGATVLPGLQDSHFHLMSTGATLRSLNVLSFTTVAQVLAAIESADVVAGTDWILASQLEESRLDERRSPSLAELDAAGRGRPVFVNDRGLHFCLLNSEAARRLGLDDEVTRNDGRMGEALGGLTKERLSRVLPASYREGNLRAAARHAAEVGLTKLHAIEGGELFDDGDAAMLREIMPTLPVRIHLMWSTDDVDAVADWGATAGGGDVCLDGSLGSHTAHLTRDYADAPGQRGVEVRALDHVTAMFASAQAKGIQYAVHAIGDAAVATAVSAIERACPDGNELRHRIEHFGLPNPELIATAARLRIGISTQPGFAVLRGQAGGVYESRLGTDRLRSAYPLRSLLDAGLVVSAGSDSDVTTADPFFGVYSAVNHPQQMERVSVAEAITMYTGAAEWMAGGDPAMAYITRDTPADFTITDRDPFITNPTELQSVRAIATVVSGHSVGR